MTQFILEVVGQENTEEGNIVIIRGTGVGARDGPLMTRAKAKALTVTRFGRDVATMTETTDIEGKLGDVEREVVADKSDDLFTGPVDAVRDKLKAFRKDGLFAQVESITEQNTTRYVNDQELEEVFGPVAGLVDTYKYRILVTTNFSFA